MNAVAARDVGVVAERLALVRVRDVQLDDRRFDHVERIEDRDRRVRERRRIDDDAVGAVDAAVDPVDDLRLAVRLVERDRQAALLGARAHISSTWLSVVEP